MSMPSATCADRRTALSVRVASYVELSKPRIAALVLVTVAVAAFVGSWARPDPLLLLHTLIGTALVAASASALNQWLERASDSRMPRTADRPLPAGRISPAEVLFAGASACVAGVLYLGVLVNWLTAVIGLLTWFLYVVVYTPMKALTPANTVVGAVAGALPVLIGWTAVGAPLALASGGLQAATLFFIVYLWQFPHFMAIAWIYREQYAAARLQMLTVVDPTGRRAGVQSVVAALALLPVSLLPMAEGLAGSWYPACALVLSGAYLYFSMRFFLERSEPSARRLLRASLVYLPALLGLLMTLPLL
jgi:protoheme IX farnesyltransferase